jgi:2,6-dihydroxypyridine 3-monooxygenase
VAAQPIRVGIVGGSLGGLTTALVLRDIGCEVDVFERSPVELSGFGAGIVVHEATVRYLVDRLGMALDNISVPSRVLQYLGAGGKVTFERPSPYRFTAWNTVFRALAAELGDARYHLGHALVGFDQDEEGVDVRFANGRAARYDLLATLGDAITYGLIEHSHIVAYQIPSVAGQMTEGERLVNFVWYRNVTERAALDELMTDKDGLHRPLSLHPGIVQQRYVDEIRETARRELPPQLAEMVDRTPQPFVQAIVDVESPKMAFGRVAILGDGAFTARPHAAAGTAKAAENAWTLAAALEGAVDVPSALAAWEPGQLALGSQLVTRAKEIGERSQLHGTWRPGDPDLQFGLYGPGR